MEKTNTLIIERICNQSFGLDRYTQIMERMKNQKSILDDDNFKTLFNGYYGVRRNKEWREAYYLLFQECREKNINSVTFEYIIQKLFKIKGQVEASFSSKMLASINPTMPLLDRRVFNYFKLEIEGVTPEKRLADAVKKYDIIIKRYQEPKQQRCIGVFNELFPSYPNNIPDIKKIDCFVWLLG